jgi:hypothetical protein
MKAITGMVQSRVTEVVAASFQLAVKHWQVENLPRQPKSREMDPF